MVVAICMQAAILFIAVRSYTYRETVYVFAGNHRVSIAITDGGIVLMRFRGEPFVGLPRLEWKSDRLVYYGQWFVSSTSLPYFKTDSTGSIHMDMSIGFVPMSVVLQLYCFRLLMLYNRVMSLRRTGVFCNDCGYDLRASANVCPECGKAVRPEVLNKTQGEK